MIANGFRHPFGDGVYTPEIDGDGYYVFQDFDVKSPYFGGSHHRAEDWAPEFGNVANVPLVSPGHGTVLDVGWNSSHGNYIVISHQLPYSIVFDGHETDSITTLHLHLSRLATYASGASVRLGDTLEAGQQFGLMGATGLSAGLVHDHFEIRLDGDLPLAPGYQQGAVDLPWVDPTDFILAHRYLGAVTGTEDADAISANVGSDSVTGGFGADTLSGAAGTDLLYGNQGSDQLFGGDGADTLYGGQDADLLYGNHDSDQFLGGDGADTLYGGQDSDTLDGNGGNDLLYGNRGADSLDGGDGADTLYGGQDADRLNGGNGDDILFGNVGADTLTGGQGADTFHVSGTDTIADFDGAAGDRVVAAEGLSGLAVSNGGTLASFADGSSVVLLGVAVGTVSPDWFLIV